MYTARLTLCDGTVRNLPVTMTGNSALLAKRDLPEAVNFIDFLPDFFNTAAGTPGCFVVPSVERNGHAGEIRFFRRENQECEFECSDMPLYFRQYGDRATLAVVTGMPLDYVLIAGVRDGIYYLYPRFILDGDAADEDIEVKFFELSGRDACWQGAARRYRQYQLDRGACSPLRDRRRTFPAAGEAALGPEVRIRLAWKPVPSPVPDQTEATEPPIHVAITFRQCEAIIDEFHRQGIEHAEFCLVGWNKSGHDGRFPDLFPVEPLLGGEAALEKVIRKARNYGYLICAHTNLLDSYTIAKRWNADNCLRQRDGSIMLGGDWGGGKSRFLCPEMAHRQYAAEDMAAMRRLGFYGTHYLDVMSILEPEKCYDPRHPLSRRESAYWRGRTLALARETVGASGSEGSLDFCIGDLDYVLYTIFHLQGERPRPLIDRHIPFWHLVYHGIVHYNVCCDSVNAAIKSDRRLALLNLAWGGRPLSYFYAKFLSSGTNWMGEEDLGFTTPEQLAADVGRIKADYERFRTISDLQFEFMDDFEEAAPGVFKVVYADGSVLIFNFNADQVECDGHRIGGLSFIRV